MQLWNYNAAYYKQIKKWTAPCKTILDVGCGDGWLISYLETAVKSSRGIDIEPSCIDRRSSHTQSAHARFGVL